MRFLNRRLHTILDGGAALAFFVAPTALGFFDPSAVVSYAVAAAYLLLALSAARPHRAVPFAAHGAIEAALAFALVALAWLLAFEPAALYFYVVAGVVTLVAWSATDYRGEGAGGGG